MHKNKKHTFFSNKNFILICMRIGSKKVKSLRMENSSVAFCYKMKQWCELVASDAGKRFAVTVVVCRRVI